MMKNEKFIRALLKNWKHLTIIFAIVTLIWMALDVKVQASDAKKQADRNTEAIIAIAQLSKTTSSNLDLLVAMGQISKETFDDLQMLPTKPYDDNGNPIDEWYLVGPEAIYLIKSPPECVTIEKIPYGERK